MTSKSNSSTLTEVLILHLLQSLNTNASDAVLPRPLGVPGSIEDCRGKDGLLNMERFNLLMEYENQEAAAQQTNHIVTLILVYLLAGATYEEQTAAGDDSNNEQMPRQKKTRREKGVAFYLDEHGNKKRLLPTMSHWYNLYCVVDESNGLLPAFESTFRKRFRCPYSYFRDKLFPLCCQSEYFERWWPGKVDATKNPATPLKLLILTSQRYLGRGWTFDDLSEATAISEEVIRVFFHQFIKFGANTLYERYVCNPAMTNEWADTNANEYKAAGFPGCIGSMDATHIALEKVTYRLKQSHLSHKLPYTARTYNLTCNHRRQILCTTNGHPARWNDKTIVNFDELAVGLQRGNILEEYTFELYEMNDENKVVTRKYVGPWLMVDNGYLNWATNIPPYKVTTSVDQLRFSKWLESLRKDVECTFGILKGRWRILKAGIRIQSIADADRIWKTCCALHNMLLEEDGLDKRWNEGVPSDWEGPMGEFDQAADFEVGAVIPASIQRLNNPQMFRNYDTSHRGTGDDREEEEISEAGSTFDTAAAVAVRTTADGCTVVRTMTRENFRQKIVEHFAIAYKRHEIIWPTRCNMPHPA